MSLILSYATPQGTKIKSTGGVVSIGPVEMPIKEFFWAAMYVLTNTDLETDDPRLEFIEAVRKLAKIKGFNNKHNPRARRLGLKTGQSIP